MECSSLGRLPEFITILPEQHCETQLSYKQFLLLEKMRSGTKFQ